MRKLNDKILFLIVVGLLASCGDRTQGATISGENLYMHAIDNGLVLLDTVRGFGWRIEDNGPIDRFRVDLKTKGGSLQPISYDRNHLLVVQPAAETRIQIMAADGSMGQVHKLGAPIDSHLTIGGTSLICFWLANPNPFLGSGNAINLNQIFLYDVDTEAVTTVATRRIPLKIQVHKGSDRQLLLISGGKALEIQDLTAIAKGQNGFVALIPLETGSEQIPYEVISSADGKGIFIRPMAGDEYLYLTLPPKEVIVTLVDYSRDVRAMAKANQQNWFLLGNGDLRYWSPASQSMVTSKVTSLDSKFDRLDTLDGDRLLAWSKLSKNLSLINVTTNTVYSVLLDSPPTSLWSTDNTLFVQHGGKATTSLGSQNELTLIDTTNGNASTLALGTSYDQHFRLDDTREMLLDTNSFSVLIINRARREVLYSKKYFGPSAPPEQVINFAHNDNFLYILSNIDAGDYVTSLTLTGEHKLHDRFYPKEHILEETP